MSKTEEDKFISAVASGRDVIIDPCWIPAQVEIVLQLDDTDILAMEAGQ